MCDFFCDLLWYNGNKRLRNFFHVQFLNLPSYLNPLRFCLRSLKSKIPFEENHTFSNLTLIVILRDAMQLSCFELKNILMGGWKLQLFEYNL